MTQSTTARGSHWRNKARGQPSQLPKRKGMADPIAVQEILRAALRQSGLDKHVARYQFVLHWKDVVGADIAARTRPECLKNGVLVVRVTDSAWAQELSFQKQIILERLKAYVAEGEVLRDVYFYVAGK